MTHGMRTEMVRIPWALMAATAVWSAIAGWRIPSP